jgi:tetraacyldisaccharide 4'-kinase
MTSAALALPLLPLSMAYGSAALLRRLAYRAGLLRSVRVAAPVVSVGSLAVGGSGKTPVTRHLAEELLAAGLRVGVVHDAYGGSLRGEARLDPTLRWSAGAARCYGDEALMLAGWLERAIVTCGRDKLAAARLAVEHGAQVVIVDDGFQHLRLHRDLDVVLDDGPMLPLPAGPGRELGLARRSADLLWRHARDGAGPAGPADVVSRSRPSHLLGVDGRDLGPAAQLAGRRVFLLAGIARPSAFARLVAGLGALVVGRAFVRDHRAISERRLRRAARARPDLVLCTEKDAVRLAGEAWAADVVALCCRVELVGGAERLHRALDRAVRC